MPSFIEDWDFTGSLSLPLLLLTRIFAWYLQQRIRELPGGKNGSQPQTSQASQAILLLQQMLVLLSPRLPNTCLEGC